MNDTAETSLQTETSSSSLYEAAKPSFFEAYKYNIVNIYDPHDGPVLETAIWIPEKKFSIYLRNGNVTWSYKKESSMLAPHERFEHREDIIPWNSEKLKKDVDSLQQFSKLPIKYLKTPKKIFVSSEFVQLAEETMKYFFIYENLKNNLCKELEKI